MDKVYSIEYLSNTINRMNKIVKYNLKSIEEDLRMLRNKKQKGDFNGREKRKDC